MTAIHFSKSIIRTSMPTRWTRKTFLGIETPLDYAMALVREDKLAKARQLNLTPRQKRKFEQWLKERVSA
jgi:hypothetical protein